ncbi:MAG: hypothetical protein ABGY24_17860 [bacterium]
MSERGNLSTPSAGAGGERGGSGEGAGDEISISPSSGGVGNRFHSWTQYCVFHSSTVFEATSVQSGTSVAL